VFEKEEKKKKKEKRETMEKKKRLIDDLEKWNGNNTQNENKEKGIVPDKNVLTFN